MQLSCLVSGGPLSFLYGCFITLYRPSLYQHSIEAQVNAVYLIRLGLKIGNQLDIILISDNCPLCGFTALVKENIRVNIMYQCLLLII